MIKFVFANHSSIRSSIFPDFAHMRGYGAGALIPPENHNESLWNFLLHTMIENDNGQCFLIKLGGELYIDAFLANLSQRLIVELIVYQ